MPASTNGGVTIAADQIPAFSEETTPDGGRKRVIGPIVAWAVVIIVAMLLGTVLLMTGTLKPDDLARIPMPRPW